MNLNLENPEEAIRIPVKFERQNVPDEFPKPEEYLQAMLNLGLFDHARAYRKVLELAQTIQEAGGRALLVGGSVRDALMGKISKDFDMEVYGLAPEEIEIAAQKIGEFPMSAELLEF